MATDQEARDAGFVLPKDDDWIRDGDDAITNNAKKSLDLVNASKFFRGKLTTTSNLATIAPGAWEVVSGTVSVALGLPTGLSGALVMYPTDGVNFVYRWYPRSNTPATYHMNLSSTGLSRWFKLEEETVTPMSFGAIGDGVADDSTALELFFAEAAAVGGNYSLGMAIYKTTRQIWIPDTRSGFNVRGMGEILSQIILTANMQYTVLAGRDIRFMNLSRFRIGGANGTQLASHGISISDAVACETDDITVTNYQNTAILFFRYTETATVERNKIRRCVAQGGGVANNGFLHETSRYYLIEDCQVFNLNMDGSPGYGLQAKNSCTSGHILGGQVVNSPAAVAFGSDDATSTNDRATVSGVIAVGCKWGVIMSGTRYSSVDILVDGAGMPDGGHPVRIGARCTEVHVKIQMHRLPVGRTLAYIGSSGNTVEIAPLLSAPGALAEFVVGLQNTTLIYNGNPAHAIITDLANNPNNVVLLGQAGPKVSNAVGRTVTVWDNVNKRSQLIYGDSGLRQVPGVPAAGMCFVRRCGNIVTLIIRDMPLGDPVLMNIPDGFRPDYQPGYGFVARSGSRVPVYLTIAGNNIAQNGSVTGTLYANLTYSTNDPWPTSLPGTAVGSIPV